MKKSWLPATVLTLSLSMLLAACGSGGGQPANSSGGAGKEKFVVATEAAYPPFEKMEGDKMSGYSIDVIQAAAEAGGFEVENRNTTWDLVFTDLENGKVDASISSITITDERKQKFDFSEPYFEATQLIMVPEDSTVTKLEDLKGLKVGVQIATTGDTVVGRVLGATNQDIKRYDDLPSAVDDFFNKRVDAVVADNGVIKYFADQIKGGKYKLLKDDSFEKEHYGIMVKKGNKEMLDKINNGLKIIKENGKLKELQSKYFPE
ncbi:basic amino acid ABC transporter substrate-binding protein [Brevibacillus daliensis]|uniref:basic amino acid ABC transporter substrate-binding protein n=1 Tax=Brevibacillus daliensis TaxID=2892995 RepID=UPI0035A01DEE